MFIEIEVDNIKCGGCVKSIQSALLKLATITAVEVDVEAGVVKIEGEVDDRANWVSTLASMGYPEVGSVAGMKAAGAKAKSFVSCAVGKLS